MSSSAEAALYAEIASRLQLESSASGVFSDRWLAGRGPLLASHSPTTGRLLGELHGGSEEDYQSVVTASLDAFRVWRTLPPPARGEVVRQIGLELRAHKRELGLLVTLEAGKIRAEGEGEVQEMIDMCDLATGLSRQLYGRTMPSERPEHRMFEQWHPLGPVGVITAFNFPVAVWAWNALVAAVCGDTVIWKPSPATPLTAVAVQQLVQRVLERNGLPAIFSLCAGGSDVGQWLADDRRLPLISATGSCRMGRAVGQRVAARLGRSLLELGGNNAIILSESANLDLAVRAITFAAVGTAGQRCTTLRRLIVHQTLVEPLLQRLTAAYASLPIGDPWDDHVLVGPLISEAAVQNMLLAIEAAQQQGGELVCGGQRLERPGHFVTPAIVRAQPNLPMLREETFAPILYVTSYQQLDEAIDQQNDVDQGLSSAIFTERLGEAERFLSCQGSDCGIANVNIGTSGAEIGGAFGGEKDTGGGREAGSDAWKAYMRRQTCTVNYGHRLPLAQGIDWGAES